jgi:hypothetical protein
MTLRGGSRRSGWRNTVDSQRSGKAMDMRKNIMIISALTLFGAGMGGWAATKTRAEAATTKRLFLDVHELGKGKVTAKDVAGAHQKDLATEGKYGVHYKAYWVDEKEGKVYCLAEAPSAQALDTVHRKAHGLVAKTIMEVTSDNMSWTPTPGMKLYMDVHRLGPGKVTAKDVAGAHKKDLAVEDKHQVKYLNYWFDAESGTVMCLSEAPSEEAALAVHKEAHGLMPDSIEEVSEGR